MEDKKLIENLKQQCETLEQMYEKDIAELTKQRDELLAKVESSRPAVVEVSKLRHV